MVIGIPGRLKYMVGSAVVPEAGGLRFILNTVNEAGEYSGEFAKELAKRWPAVQKMYRQWYIASFGKLQLGKNQSVTVQSDTIVINMVVDVEGKVDFDALEKSLAEIASKAAFEGATVHLPVLGTKKNKKKLDELLTKTLIKQGVNTTVYTSA